MGRLYPKAERAVSRCWQRGWGGFLLNGCGTGRSIDVAWSIGGDCIRLALLAFRLSGILRILILRLPPASSLFVRFVLLFLFLDTTLFEVVVDQVRDEGQGNAFTGNGEADLGLLRKESRWRQTTLLGVLR